MIRLTENENKLICKKGKKKLGRKADKYECKDGYCEIEFDQIKIEFDKLSRIPHLNIKPVIYWRGFRNKTTLVKIDSYDFLLFDCWRGVARLLHHHHPHLDPHTIHVQRHALATEWPSVHHHQLLG